MLSVTCLSPAFWLLPLPSLLSPLPLRDARVALLEDGFDPILRSLLLSNEQGDGESTVILPLVPHSRGGFGRRLHLQKPVG